MRKKDHQPTLSKVTSLTVELEKEGEGYPKG